MPGPPLARDKPLDLRAKLIPVDCARQMLPGSVEYALGYVIAPELELAEFAHRFCHAEGGAPAYAPALLLKIVLLADWRGRGSARALESACQQNVLFRAVCGGATPHCPTLAAFVSTGGAALSGLLTPVRMVGDRPGRIGGQLLAIAGGKLASHAAQARSGTRQEFPRAAKKRDRAVRRMLARHRHEDLTHTGEPSVRLREARQGERRKQEAEQLRTWLQAPPVDRRGVRGGSRKSKRADNASAKMAPGKGVIHGDTGVAVVEEQPQILVDAQAPGGGQEQALRVPVGEAGRSLRAEATLIPAAAGSQREDNLQHLAEQDLDA